MQLTIDFNQWEIIQLPFYKTTSIIRRIYFCEDSTAMKHAYGKDFFSLARTTFLVEKELLNLSKHMVYCTLV